MATLKEVAEAQTQQKIVTEVGLQTVLTALKGYIDTQDAATAQQASGDLTTLSARVDTLNTLLNVDGATANAIDTYNEIKAFLEDYTTTDGGLKDILDALKGEIDTAIAGVEASVTAEQTRAEAAESALAGRIATLEGMNVMTAAEATTIFNGVFGAPNAGE